MNTNYIKVFSGRFLETQRVFQALEQENICAIIKDEGKSGLLAGFGTSIFGLQEIHVHQDEFERTTSLLEDLATEAEA
ncbi:hypothetical protein MHTCC0001_33660 [Flavobacteriaceae bacterium MHTCC 0001]